VTTIKTTEAEDARLEKLAVRADDEQVRGTPRAARAKVLAYRALSLGLAELERRANAVRP
jgi:hypothetical protein